MPSRPRTRTDTADLSVVEFREPAAERREPAAPPQAEPAEPAARREAPADSKPADSKPTADTRKKRGKLRSILMLGGVAAVVAGSAAFYIQGGRWVSSDDAYVRAAKLMVSTDVSGIVDQVDVKQGQRVKAGDVLFRVDPRQYQIALNAAKANLAQVRLTLEAAQKDYARLQSDIAAQTAQVQLAQANFQRAQDLVNVNAGTRAAYDQMRFTLEAAQRSLDSLKQQAQVALTRLGGKADLPIEQLPQYQQAKAQVDEAQRQLDHTTVRAPFSGTVTAVDTLQPGTFLVSQTAALTNTGAIGLVSDENVWVEANLKETDLTYAKPGDPVDVSIDAYPDRVWHGHVDSIFPASGSEFSILPAQNASGNWVKVVQRIPVRVKLDRDVSDPPLRAGMSAVVEVDTGHKRHWSDLWPSWLPSFGLRASAQAPTAAGKTSDASQH